MYTTFPQKRNASITKNYRGINGDNQRYNDAVQEHSLYG